MANITLAAPLTRFLPGTPPGEKSWSVTGTTVRAAIECLLAEVPGLRGYLLDDHGSLRHHIAAFVNGIVVTDKRGLTDPLPPDGELFLVPALSGG